jgi:peptidoglycan/LPS O-acetylase OafA/YrhL
MDNSRLHQVDVWRFIAISLVLWAHLIVYSHPWYATFLAPGLIVRFEMLGMVGVKIFFCISGYVICRGMVREWERTGRIDMRGFYRRRIYRILPPLYVYIGVVALLTALGTFKVPANRLAQSAAFLCNIEPLGECGWPLGHTWSLAYEEQFYLVFPVMFSLMTFMQRPQRLLWMCPALALGCIATHFTGSPYLNACLGYVLCMLAGCACALYWNRLQPILQRLPLPLWCLAVVLVPGSVAMWMPPVVGDIVIPFVLPIVICVAVFATPVHRPIVKKLFCNRYLAHFGCMSYGLYLWQQLATCDYGFSSPLFAWLLVLVTFVFAHYSFVHVEQPLIRRGAARLPAGPKPGHAAQAPFDAPLADDRAQTPSI